MSIPPESSRLPDTETSSDVGPALNVDPSSIAPFEKHHRLTKWVVENGGFLHPNVKIRHNDQSGFLAVVVPEKRVEASTVIAKVPITVTISVLNALNVEPFSNHGCTFPEPFLRIYQQNPGVLQTFFLMEQYVLGESSWWAPYLATLPTISDIEDLQFESEEDAVWVRGSNVEAALMLQNQTWYQQFTSAMELLKSHDWENAVKEVYTWKLYRWAAAIYGSRSFTSQVLTDTKPADTARPMGHDHSDHEMLSKLFKDRFAVLLPLLDILNHKPNAKVEWQAQPLFVGLQVLTDYADGEELFNNYGPRDNEGLLIAYGFVLEDNPFEHITIAIQKFPGSPLEVARTWPRDDRSNEDYRCFLFDSRHPIVQDVSSFERALFSYDLLDSLSLLCANDRELQEMYNKQQTLMSSALGANFEDFRNLLATISQIMQECKARLIRTQTTDPASMDPPLLPQTNKHRYAQIYRNNQLRILKAAILTCAVILVHASTNQDKADLLLTIQMKLPQYHLPELDKMFDRLQFLTAMDELFTLEQLLEVLPSPVSNSLRGCMRNITEAWNRLQGQQTHVDKIKSGFCLALSAMCIEIRSGVQYPTRQKSWIERLTSYYPPEDENWSYVPGPGPYSPEEEPPAALVTMLQAATLVSDTTSPHAAIKQWLEPKMISWGWNVMEEEGVRVPIEIEAYHSANPAEVTGPMGFLIYCKQE